MFTPKTIYPEAGLALRTINHDSIIRNTSTPPIIVNDLDIRYTEDDELLKKYIMTNYEGATYSMVPKCDCGEMMGGHLRGRVCPHCHSEVLSHTELPIESNLWLKVPEGVPYFISPIAYMMLSNAFETNKIDVIRWMCDVHYKAAFDDNEVIVKLRDMGVKRGYNNFIENFWQYIDILLERRLYTSASDKRKMIKPWLQQNSENIFVEFLPLPNRLALVTEKTPTGRYGELSRFSGAIQAAYTMAGLKRRISPPTQIINEATAIRCVMLLAEYHAMQQKWSIGRKEGLVRKHICGSRMPFTARNVITSLHGVHDYDELHIPWAMAIGLFRLHLTNKFLKAGYTPNEISSILTGHVNREHPLIRQYLNELIAESPYKGIPCCFNRNPTLLRGSIQQLYITRVKDDVNDNTISLSVLVLRSYNADFDGDVKSHIAI